LNPTHSTWRTSSYSGTQGNCVEVAATPDTMTIRDSKNRTGPALTFETTDWINFTSSL
jgi:Domain of unknown function (DUF397)